MTQAWTDAVATSQEAWEGGQEGLRQSIRRHIMGRSLDHGRASPPGSRGYRSECQKWGHAVMGRIAEVVASRVLGLVWHPGGASLSKGSDLADKTEVRWTERPDGSLTIYETDKDHYWVSLVIGEHPKFRVFKPVPIGPCKQDRWWRPSYGLWWVPQADVIKMIGGGGDLRLTEAQEGQIT